jgi:hypothetical protein
MNSRERWVVYPLLVWSLAMGFRSQYETLFQRNDIKCREVRIVDDAGKTRILMAADNASGGLILFGKQDGAPVLQIQEKGGLEQIKDNEKAK